MGEDLVEYSDNNIIVTYERYYKKVQDYEYAKQIILHEADKKKTSWYRFTRLC